MDLNNKSVLITGSEQGIGAETAKKFAQENSNLIITYLNKSDKAREVEKECRKLGASRTLVLQLDVRNNKSIKNAVNKTVKEFGKIDVLVNNAGTLVRKKLAEQSFREIENQVRTNLEGLIKMTCFALNQMKNQSNGIIINIASGAGKSAFIDLSTYCATKFGVRGFTKAVAKETEGTGIQLYIVNPDMTATQMTNFKGRPPEEVAEVVLKTAREEFEVNSGSDIDVWEKK